MDYTFCRVFDATSFPFRLRYNWFWFGRIRSGLYPFVNHWRQMIYYVSYLIHYNIYKYLHTRNFSFPFFCILSLSVEITTFRRNGLIFLILFWKILFTIKRLPSTFHSKSFHEKETRFQSIPSRFRIYLLRDEMNFHFVFSFYTTLQDHLFLRIYQLRLNFFPFEKFQFFMPLFFLLFFFPLSFTKCLYKVVHVVVHVTHANKGTSVSWMNR